MGFSSFSLSSPNPKIPPITEKIPAEFALKEQNSPLKNCELRIGWMGGWVSE
jgi:hypothetical protein